MLGKEVGKPKVYFALEEGDIVQRVVRAALYGIATLIRGPRCVNDMNKDVCPPNVVKKLIAQSLSLVRIRNDSGNIDDGGRHKPHTLDALGVSGIAYNIKLTAGT
jgi:hypothetical protein